jgi:NAD(P)-dependent dehydrogenase (short-subunit alcohol dehydrogenase family)
MTTIAMVTGAASGLGRELALQLAASGRTVVCVDYDTERLQLLEAELAAADRACLCVQANIARREDVSALMQRVAAVYGHLDLLINNAGVIHPFGRIDQVDPEVAQRVFDVNFWGTTHMTVAALPLLRKGSAPLLVNVVSIGAIVTTIGQGFYCASKAAIVKLTETLELELAADGVDTMLVFPGAMNTNIMSNAAQGAGDAQHRQALAALSALEASSGMAKRMLTTPAAAARRVIASLERRPRRLHVGTDSRLLGFLARFMPVTCRRLIAAAMRKVPALAEALR